MYLIIFGTRGVTYTKESGEFHCPGCAAKDYRQRRVRRFFTLYFIPLLPLDLLGEYVECSQCKATWDLEVLGYNPEGEVAEFEAKYFIAVKNTMLLMMLADGVIDDDELDAVSYIYKAITDKEITADEARQQAAQLEASGQTVHDFLAQIGPMLNDPGREMVVEAAFSVAMADGDFDESEQQLLMEIADAMHMSAAHARGVIASLVDRLQLAADGEPDDAQGEAW